MYKTLIAVLVVLVAVTGISFAGGQSGDKPIELTWMLSGDTKWTEENHLAQYAPEGYDGDKEGIRVWQADQFMAENPGIKLNTVIRDVSQGSMTLDSMMAAGKPPDIIHDAAWLTWKYLNGNYALPLDEYIDISRFQENLVDIYSREGHCYALVHNNVGIGLSINLDMLKEIGMELPPIPEWDWDAYDAIAAKLKSALDIPVTVVMAHNGLSQWEQMWLHSAGGVLFSNKDYSKVTLNSPEYGEALDYWKSLDTRGYSLGYPWESIDDTGIEAFAAGEIFSCTEQTGHVSGWVPQMLENGRLDKEFEYTFTEVPHKPGLSSAPVASYQATVVAHKSDDEARNLATIKLVEYIFRPDNVRLDMIQGTTPSVKDDIPPEGRLASSSAQAMLKLMRDSACLDSGAAVPNIREITRGWAPMAHAWFRDEISTQELMDQMEAFANKKLAEN